MVLGWLTPTELAEPTTITDLKELNTSKEAYLIRNDGYANEYYIVENRQQEGTKWDASLPGSGIVVFHIDYDSEVWREGVPNSANYKRYSIIPANNSDYSSAYWAYPYINNNSLTNESSPAATLLHANTDGSMLMSKPITNIQVTDGIASFDFMGGASSVTPLSTDLSSPFTVLYDIGPVRIVRMPNGEIKKVMKR